MSCYRLEGRKVLDESNPEFCIDIRTLVDSTSDEFSRCDLSASKRLLMIDSLGEQQVFKAFRAVYEGKGRQFLEGVDGVWDLWVLRNMAANEVASRTADSPGGHK